MLDDTDLVTVSVTVPRAEVANIQRTAADLVDDWMRPQCGTYAIEHASQKEQETKTKAVMRRFGKTVVRRTFEGGVSEVWPLLLERLAARVLDPGDAEDTENPPDEHSFGTGPGVWVRLSELRTDLGLSSRTMSGTLGAAEKRISPKRLPYVKQRWDGELWYWMPTKTAEHIRELAAARIPTPPPDKDRIEREDLKGIATLGLRHIAHEHGATQADTKGLGDDELISLILDIQH